MLGGSDSLNHTQHTARAIPTGLPHTSIYRTLLSSPLLKPPSERLTYRYDPSFLSSSLHHRNNGRKHRTNHHRSKVPEAEREQKDTHLDPDIDTRINSRRVRKNHRKGVPSSKGSTDKKKEEEGKKIIPVKKRAKKGQTRTSKIQASSEIERDEASHSSPPHGYHPAIYTKVIREKNPNR